MKVNAKEEILDLFGSPILDPGQSNRLKKPVSLTVGMALCQLLVSPNQEIDGYERLRRYELAKRIKDADEFEFSAEDCEMINELALSFVQPEVLSRIREIFKQPKE